MQGLLFYQGARHLRQALRGCSAAAYDVAMAIAEASEDGTLEAYCSLRGLARITGRTASCVSKVRRKLLEIGLIEHLGGCLYRVKVMARSAAVGASAPRPNQEKVKRAQRTSWRQHLYGLFLGRVQHAIASSPVRIAEVKAALRQGSSALIHAVRGNVLPRWDAMTRELQKRGLSACHAEDLAMAFHEPRIMEVCWYADKRGYGAGAIVTALVDGWAVG